jgi:hypothetical protein
MSETSPSKSARIRELNDQLRREHVGGRIVITSGVQALGTDEVGRILAAVSEYDNFTADNDPWGEHDCAVLTVSGRRIIFKHDYYDSQLTYYSPDASDPAVTTRRANHHALGRILSARYKAPIGVETRDDFLSPTEHISHSQPNSAGLSKKPKCRI